MYDVESYRPLVIDYKPEVCIVEVPALVIIIETGLGYYTFPLLVAKIKMNAEVRDWSSEISIKSSMELGIVYYNSVLSIWAPFIEPWELNFNSKIEKNGEENVGNYATNVTRTS